MYILVINSGSSSIKFALIQSQHKSKTHWGQVEGIGTSDAKLIFETEQNETSSQIGERDHNESMNCILDELKKHDLFDKIEGIGHRVVHGGEKFSEPTLINEEVVNTIKELIPLAPLHNPGNLLGIEATLQAFPALQQFAIFDTAFHQTIPEPNFLFPVPYEYYEEHSVRRYGFHGISYEYLLEKIIELGLDPMGSYLFAHLGNGCSAAAVHRGKCVDTTMGMTPLDGLMMGTRSGAIDPGLFQYIAKCTGDDIDQITTTLNKKSGLKGISGISQDMRTLDEAKNSNSRARLALELFEFRLSKELMGLASSLPKLDGLIFTGGIGETSSETRREVCAKLHILGVDIDPEKNETRLKEEHRFLNFEGETPVIVIKAGEEVQIASHVEEKMESQLSC